MDEQGATFTGPLETAGNDCSILRLGVLSRAINIEVAEADHGQPPLSPIELEIMLALQLADFIGCDQRRYRIFALRAGRRVTVHRSGRGEHEALDPLLAGGLEQLPH